MPLFISEYARIALDGGSKEIGAPMAPPLRDQRVDIGAQSMQSEPWSESTTFISVCATEPCCLAFGEDPEAQYDLHYVPAGVTLFYGVHQGHRLAVCGAGD